MVAEWRDDERQPTGWGELQEFKGFGPKTVIKITDWIKSEDPFGAFKLDGDIRKVKQMLRRSEGSWARREAAAGPDAQRSDLALDENARARRSRCTGSGPSSSGTSVTSSSRTGRAAGRA
jgi:hypothetical protein